MLAPALVGTGDRSAVQQEGWRASPFDVLPESVPLPARRIANPLDVRFANGVHLAGYDVEPDTTATGDGTTEFRLTLFGRWMRTRIAGI